jgi:hypothetical protein
MSTKKNNQSAQKINYRKKTVPNAAAAAELRIASIVPAASADDVMLTSPPGAGRHAPQAG